MSRYKIITALLLCMIFSSIQPVRAADEVTLLQRYTTETGIVLYVKGCPGMVEEMTYQVGMTECAVESFETVEASKDDIYTLIIWDNSLSIMNGYQDKIRALLTDIVGNRSANEYFSIATIGETLDTLVDYTKDYKELKKTIDGVEKENKGVYIVTNLYNAIKALEDIAGTGYKRIVLVTDGVDEVGTGYSRKELDKLMEKTPYPIHVVAIPNSNKEELQELYSVSRASGAESISIESLNDTITAAQIFGNDYNYIKVEVTIPENERDGSSRNSKLTVTTADGVFTGQFPVDMPFGKSEILITTAPTTEPTGIPEPTKEPDFTSGVTEGARLTEPAEIISEDEETVQDNYEKEGFMNRELDIFGLQIPVFLIIAAVVILAAVVVIIICIPKGKEKPEEVKPDYKELDKQLLNRKEEHADAARTKILNTEQEDNHPTEILPANEAAENKQPYQIVLINQKDSVKTYRLSFNDRVVIGRGKNSCNIPIADDSAVSERHCEVIAENERFYLNDLGSSNGTWLNGRKIVVKSELKSGDVIKLGRGEYTIRLQ